MRVHKSPDRHGPGLGEADGRGKVIPRGKRSVEKIETGLIFCDITYIRVFRRHKIFYC